jgi:anti-sigma factor RsiW
MTCAELEILLCDYMDGTLSSGEKAAMEDHISSCGLCAQLARDAAGVAAFVETVPAIEAPTELLTRIVRQIPERRSWWSKLGDSWMEGLLKPRFAMGLAMTVLSFSMLARLGHVDARRFARADWDPSKLWQALDDRTYRVWDRTVQYYDNMPLMADIQARWNEWSDQEQNQNGGSGSGQ